MNESLPSFTILIIALTAYVSYRGFTRVAFRDKLIFEPIRILRGKEHYRLVSAGFLHANWTHFLFNMFSLYMFGGRIEAWFGPLTVLAVYFAGIIGGNLLSLWLHRHHDYRALGASGGVCGVIFAFIFLFPGSSISMLFVPIGIPAPIYAILFIVFSFIGMRTQAGNIGHDAHLGGALVGLLTVTFLHPHILEQSPFLYALVVVGTSVLFFFAYNFYSPVSRGARRVGREITDKTRRARREADRREMDTLLDKMLTEGDDSLNWRERRRLKSIGRKLKNKDTKE